MGPVFKVGVKTLLQPQCEADDREELGYIVKASPLLWLITSEESQFGLSFAIYLVR